MLYLATSPQEPLVRAALDQRRIGLMSQPGSDKAHVGWLWAADNGCFNEATFNPERWANWLCFGGQPRSGCLFAAVPDVLGDAVATAERFAVYEPLVRDGARLPVAFVLQDGCTVDLVPWELCDAVFVGGTTPFKMSEQAFALAAEAHHRGKWVHVGRVNSWSRFKVWAPHADSADGTYVRFGPAKNIGDVLAWSERHGASPQLFDRSTP